MASIDELKAERVKKLNLLKENGINPFKNRGNPTINNGEFLESFTPTPSLPQGEGATQNASVSKPPLEGGGQRKNDDGRWGLSSVTEVVLVGRIMNMRSFGALTFFKLYDGYETVQIVMEANNQSNVDRKSMGGSACIEYIKSYLDTGDFVEVRGVQYITKKGEKSLLIDNIEILTKSLLPLPDKWKGLEDEDLRLRLRYMDILTNVELREMIEKKAIFYKTIRDFLEGKGFIAVDTPTLEVTTGGAEAEPFATHHNYYDLDVFMRISIGELWQKRLMAAGIPRTYEIGRAYRNEGSSPNHLQEFTNCEFYMAYADYHDGMELVKNLYRDIAIKTFNKTKFTTREHTFDLADEWIKISYADEIEKQTGVDIYDPLLNPPQGADLKTQNLAIEYLKNKLKELEIKSDGVTKERLIDSLWKYCRKNISGPAFVVDYPDFMQPLAKRKEKNNIDNSDKSNNIVEQFQVLLGGAEIGKGYSELNDPIDQRQRFNHQQSMRDAGDMESMMPDYDYVEMLEHGMPPTCGFGFGERLFAFLVDKPIREVQIFPLMKPKDEKGVHDNKKKTKVVNIVLNKEAKLEGWQTLNTVGHLSAEFAGKVSKSANLFFTGTIDTKDNAKINLNIQHAIVIKQAEATKDIFTLMEKAKENNIEIYAFTREMLNTTNDKKVIEQTKEKNFADIEFLGVLIFGEKEIIDNLTEGFELYK